MPFCELSLHLGLATAAAGFLILTQDNDRLGLFYLFLDSLLLAALDERYWTVLCQVGDIVDVL